MVKVLPSDRYDSEIKASDKKIVGRFSRRNVRLQNGVFTADLNNIVSSGDKAAIKLSAKFKAFIAV